MSRRTGIPRRRASSTTAAVEGPSRTDETKLRGRTRHNKAVNFDGVAAAGEMVAVEITGATSQTLAGVAARPLSHLL